MKKKRTRRSCAGFSLIELAIALIIMGFLIGGILKGRELIESARLRRIVSQLAEYQLATRTFIDRFDALPGDFDKASLLLDPSLKNGNGNGTLEGAGLALGSESLLFWAHLAAMNLIPSPGPIEEAEAPEFGKGAPACSLGGGFTVETTPHGLPGIWFILGKKNGLHGDGALLTPLQAMTVDKKLDNGYPTSGKVRAFDGTDSPAHSCVTSSGRYNLENKEAACALFFQF